MSSDGISYFANASSGADLLVRNPGGGIISLAPQIITSGAAKLFPRGKSGIHEFAKASCGVNDEGGGGT